MLRCFIVEGFSSTLGFLANTHFKIFVSFVDTLAVLTVEVTELHHR